MRQLSDLELQLISGGSDTIIVTGRQIQWYLPTPTLRYGYADDGPFGASGGGDDALANSQNPQPRTPGDVPCKTAAEVAALPQAERDRYNAQRIAGRVHRQIADRGDSGENEYGSLIYRDRTGNIVFTPLPGVGSVPAAWDLSAFDADPGLWANVLGWIHNHPHLSFDPFHPYHYATPSFDHPDPNNPGQVRGDWITFDAIRSNMVQEGASQAMADNLVQYISSSYQGQLKIFEYPSWDRDNATLGKEINPALDHCGL